MLAIEPVAGFSVTSAPFAVTATMAGGVTATALAEPDAAAEADPEVVTVCVGAGPDGLPPHAASTAASATAALTGRARPAALRVGAGGGTAVRSPPRPGSGEKSRGGHAVSRACGDGKRDKSTGPCRYQQKSGMILAAPAALGNSCPQSFPCCKPERYPGTARAIRRTASVMSSGDVPMFSRAKPLPCTPNAGPGLSATRPPSRNAAAGSGPRPSSRQSIQARKLACGAW